PTCHESRLNLAGLLLERGRLAEARDAYERSLAYHPEDVRALSGLGRTYLRLGDDELALGALRAAARRPPVDPRAADAPPGARLPPRLRYAWRFAALGAALAIALGGVIIVMRRPARRARSTEGSRCPPPPTKPTPSPPTPPSPRRPTTPS